MILSLHQEVRSVRVTSRGTKLLALLLGMTLFAAACGSDKKSSSSSKSTNQNATTTAPVSVPTGGTLVIGAEQEPDCAGLDGFLRRLQLGLLDDAGRDHASCL